MTVDELLVLIEEAQGNLTEENWKRVWSAVPIVVVDDDTFERANPALNALAKAGRNSDPRMPLPLKGFEALIPYLKARGLMRQ